MKPFEDPAVEAVFNAYPPALRRKLLRLRALIFETAEQTDAVGVIRETLKWGQPSYVTENPRSGSTIRIDAIRSAPKAYALYVHCQTTLIDTFKKTVGATFRYEGNRAVIFSTDEKVPEEKLVDCIRRALTYRVTKRSDRSPLGHSIR